MMEIHTPPTEQPPHFVWNWQEEEDRTRLTNIAKRADEHYKTKLYTNEMTYAIR
jgi:hypothetical protein